MSRLKIIIGVLSLLTTVRIYSLPGGLDSAKGHYQTRIFQPKIERIGRYEINSELVYENSDISAIAAADSNHALIGTDEGNYAQFCLISQAKISIIINHPVKSLVKLLPGSANSEADIEGITVIGNSFYITGSHGLAQKSGEFQRSRHNCFRFGIDPETGTKIGNVETSTLRDVLQKDPVLCPYYKKVLQQQGVNIEALAAKGNKLYFGLRSPNLGGNAYIIEITPEELFNSGNNKKYRLHSVHLGKALGIREMVSINTGFVIIAGNAGSEPGDSKKPDTKTNVKDWSPDRPYDLYFWDGAEKIERIGAIPVDDRGYKAEAMMVLNETRSKVELLILFDGPDGGSPTVYSIKKLNR